MLEIEKNPIKFYGYLKKNDLILFEAVVGSHAYSTNTPDSDIDKKFIYVLPQKMLYSLDYIDQINITDDYVGLELKKFLELISKANPSILELLFMPEDCIIYKHPLFDIILEHRESFLTKEIINSFSGYAFQQLKKAKGMDKMMNWEKDKVKRKDPLDFCNVILNNGTQPLKKYLDDKDLRQEFCGVVKIPNARDLYAGYYHPNYKGVVKYDKNGDIKSNELRLSSIPKSENNNVKFYFSYNKDGYVSHCRDYKNYQNWLKKRNKNRWVDNKSHGQKIDGKNMLHCIRLIDMAEELFKGEGLNVRRPNSDFLLKIRKGELDLNYIIKLAEDKLEKINENRNKVGLSDSVSRNLVNDLLVLIRDKIY